MSKWRKKPVVIEAFKWTADITQTEDPLWFIGAIQDGTVWFENNGCPAVFMQIKTLEGIMKSMPGDYIIKGIKGEIYSCKPEIFEATYELVG